MEQFLNKTDIKGQGLLDKTKEFLIKKYKQVGKLFNYSSGFGQILLTVSNHSKLVLFYVKDSYIETSFSRAKRKDSIYGLAQLQGHNANRGNGSTGVISLIPRKDINRQINETLFLVNFSRVICKDNSIPYYVSLGKEFVQIESNGTETISLPVNQGEIKVKSFVGDGSDNQMFSIANNNEIIDMNNILVEVNGIKYDVFENFKEISYASKACVVRTGLTSGIDVIFGKKVYSNIPEKGVDIKIYYPIIVGKQGDRNFGLFEFIDPIFSADGKDFNISDLFEIVVTKSFMFGSNPEDIEMTRLIAPNVNRNRVVFDVKSTKYFFESKNLFQKVEVFNQIDPNIMNVYLYPMLSSVDGALNASESDIFLDIETKNRLLENINSVRSQSIKISIDDPKIRKYSLKIKLGILLSRASTINTDEIKETKRRELNSELVKLKKTNRIVKSDIIKALSKNIDSIYVYFDTEENMLDKMGDIRVDDGEIALPIVPFVNFNGEVITENVIFEIVWL
jgi:hypothetical protein